MSHSSPNYATLEDWIANEAVSVSLDSTTSLNNAVDRIIASAGDSIELLGLGEPTHLWNEVLMFRNRVFQRLVEKHGYTAIAIESSYPRGFKANDFINGRGDESLETVLSSGFSHNFGQMTANRELIEWMRAYNADDSHRVKLNFYGFDGPLEMTGGDSPWGMLRFALDFLAPIDGDAVNDRRARTEALIGNDADWENPAAMIDPSKSVGRSANAVSLRIETEELITELETRRPELVRKTDALRYLDALQHARGARQLLTYHAGMGSSSANRISELLGIRDWMMADNLSYMIERERGRGKVFAFAHNSHLKRGLAEWKWGDQHWRWWPAGAHMSARLGDRYAMIGTSAARLPTMNLGAPQAGTLEALLSRGPGQAELVPTYRGERLSRSVIEATATRSNAHPGYFPFTPQSFTDFDWLAVID